MRGKTWLLSGCLIAVLTLSAAAGVPERAVRAAAARAARLLVRESSREGSEALARRAQALAVRHGAEVVEAVRRGGPGAIRLIEGAGEHGVVAARLLARHGAVASPVAASPRALALVARHGDEAARALIRHGRLAEPVLAELGAPAARALAAAGPRNARRIAVMAESGELARIGRTGPLLDLVGRYGDRAMEFLWRHKGALAVGAILTAFLNDPGPFLNGTRELAGAVAQEAVRPIARAPGAVMERALTPTTGIESLAALAVVIGLGLLWYGRRAERAAARRVHRIDPARRSIASRAAGHREPEAS